MEAAGIEYPRLVYPYIQKEVSLATPIPVARLCELAQVTRAGFLPLAGLPAGGGR